MFKSTSVIHSRFAHSIFLWVVNQHCVRQRLKNLEGLSRLRTNDKIVHLLKITGRICSLLCTVVNISSLHGIGSVWSTYTLYREWSGSNNKVLSRLDNFDLPLLLFYLVPKTPPVVVAVPLLLPSLSSSSESVDKCNLPDMACRPGPTLESWLPISKLRR